MVHHAWHLSLRSPAPFSCHRLAHARTAARPVSAARTVAIGDIHGAGDAFVGILQAAGLIDAVANGLAARPRSSRPATISTGAARSADLDLLMSLEDQAKSAGGRVEVLLGNHEMMNMLREITDVSPEAYASFADAKSEDRRRRRTRHGQDREARRWRRRSRSEGLVDVDAPGRVCRVLRCDGPTGSIRQMAARAQGRRPGRQRRRSCTPGIAPDAQGGIDDVNRDAARAIKAWDDATSDAGAGAADHTVLHAERDRRGRRDDLKRISAALGAGKPVEATSRASMSTSCKVWSGSENHRCWPHAGPMWFRGLSESPTEETDAQVTALFNRLGITRMVVGHTPRLPGRIAAAVRQPRLPDRHRACCRRSSKAAARRPWRSLAIASPRSMRTSVKCWWESRGWGPPTEPYESRLPQLTRRERSKAPNVRGWGPARLRKVGSRHQGRPRTNARLPRTTGCSWAKSASPSQRAASDQSWGSTSRHPRCPTCP